MDLRPRFFFTVPRVCIGVGAVNEVVAMLRDLGVGSGRVLLVTDPTLVRLGIAARIQQNLTVAGFEVAIFSEIPGEPTEAVAEAVTDSARHLHPAAVVGLGGGSALDVGKVAAAMVANPGRAGEYFSGRTFEHASAPLVLIPTTAGTGAESSRNAVISRDGRKAFVGSPFLVPSAAILDPELTLTLPPHITAWTGMDALSHCVEALLSANASPLTDAVASRGIQMIREHLPVACLRGDNAEVRLHMLVAAHLGGLALNAGVVLGHSIAYTLANRLHLAHGLSCALALAPCVAYSGAAAPERLRLIARALEVADDPTAVVIEIRRLASAVGIPHAWKDLGLARSDLPALVEECVTRYPRPNNPRTLERVSLLQIYERAWEGTLTD